MNKTIISVCLLAFLLLSFPVSVRAADNLIECGEARDIIMGGFELYLLDHKDALPESFEVIIKKELTGGRYLESVQNCPDNGKFSWSFSPAPEGKFLKNIITAGGKKYLMECACSIHGSIEVFFEASEKKKFAMPESEKKAACISNMKTVMGALELYYLDKKADARNFADLLEGRYLKCAPICYRGGNYELKKHDSGIGSAAFDVICSAHGNLEDKGE